MRGGLPGGLPGEILVNTAGRRFANENLNYNDIGRLYTYFDPHVYEYVNHPCFAVGDKVALKRLAVYKDIVKPGADPVVEADTIREVAEKLGIDPDGLEQQVAEWNASASDHVDPVFHRGEKPWETHFLPKMGMDPIVVQPIKDPPFVGYRVRAGVFGTRGGPVVDENAQIVDWENRPITGLYGAGNAIAHPFASAYPGGGGTLGPCVTFGHIAGKSVLSERIAL
jgi:hypothetical protein